MLTASLHAPSWKQAVPLSYIPIANPNPAPLPISAQLLDLTMKSAAAAAGAVAAAVAVSCFLSLPWPCGTIFSDAMVFLERWRRRLLVTPAKHLSPVRDGVVGLIGNTALIRINSLSSATGCEILAKAEFLNPGGSVKDRVAVKIVEEALESGLLRPGGLITEGSAGSTGVSLAMVAKAYGCRCHVVIPDDAAIEKSQILEALGAKVERVRPVSIAHGDHYVKLAYRRARDEEGGYFADQFENLANFRAHYQGTGPEIWKQTGGKIHAFVAAAGTGGTLAGVSCYLKEQNPNIKCYLIDPPGSGLCNKVVRGVMYTKEEAEGKRLKNPFDTITEGIGINRLTNNFNLARLDGAFRGTDQQAVEMAKFLLNNDGLFLGSSSAMNCVGAVRVAQLLGPGHTIATILCDGGTRHLSKFQNPEYLAAHDLTPKAVALEFLKESN